MRNSTLIMCMMILLTSSCIKDDRSLCTEEYNEATLCISLGLGEQTTKAVTPYNNSMTYEKQVNSVQILIFDNNKLNSYLNAGTNTSGISIKTTKGSKEVWAIVNGPDLSGISTLSEIQNQVVMLGDNSTEASKGFVMSGSKSCNLSTSSASATIPVSRLVSRIALQKITNSLPEAYGNLTVSKLFLANVVGNTTLSGDASINTWYNKMGRTDTATSSSQIIDGSSYPASCPELTYKYAGAIITNGESRTLETPYLLYCNPNNTKTDYNGWSTVFTARKTRLIVCASVGGSIYYYPVTIDTPGRNCTYTIELTITGLGATDPDQPVEKGTIMTIVSVQEWTNGATYDEII